jgi:hypothetical protein
MAGLSAHRQPSSAVFDQGGDGCLVVLPEGPQFSRDPVVAHRPFTACLHLLHPFQPPRSEALPPDAISHRGGQFEVVQPSQEIPKLHPLLMRHARIHGALTRNERLHPQRELT